MGRALRTRQVLHRCPCRSSRRAARACPLRTPANEDAMEKDDEPLRQQVLLLLVGQRESHTALDQSCDAHH
eukprot:194621-Prymnesium_polylepis.2